MITTVFLRTIAASLSAGINLILPPEFCIHLTPLNACPGGGIGRRGGFKIRFLREWGFDSPPGYQPSL